MLTLEIALLSTLAAAAGGDRRPFAPDLELREPPQRHFDLTHLRVAVSFDLAAGIVHGETTQTFAPLGDGAEVLTLHAADLDIEAIESGGANLDFATVDEELRITLPGAPESGASFDVTIRYRARPRKGLFFIAPDEAYPDKPRMLWTQGEMEDTRRWLPTWDYPNDRTTTETLVTVPAAWTAISNGHLVADTVAADGTRTFHWRQDIPHVTYLITIAAGEFVTVREASAEGVPLAYHVPPGREDQIARSFGRTADMLGFYAEWLAQPYPWAKYDQVAVVDYTFGGMENTSATTLTDTTLHDARTHNDYRSDGLVAHEIAHQWFGDLVTCKGWTHIWLNEGFATYFEALWFEHDEGRDEFAYNMFKKADGYLEETSDEYRRPVVSHAYHDAGAMFDSHAYKKGAWVLHMLRDELGDDAFQKAIRTYLGRHRERLAETDELRIAVEDATGQSLRWFFDQWLLAPGHPELEVTLDDDAKGGMIALRVRQTQDRDAGIPVFRLPLRVRVWHDDGHKDYRVELQTADQVIHLPVSPRPRAVTIDPGNRLLAKLTYDPGTDALRTQLERSAAAVDRIQAIELLLHDADEHRIDLIASALSDEFWGVRVEAAEALGKSRSKRAVEPLLAALDDADSRVRKEAAKALGKLSDGAAAARLSELLASDGSYYARAEAARALGRIGARGAFATLTDALRQESHVDIIRQRAFQGLAALGDDRAIPVALTWSRYGQPPKARVAALEALGELGGGDRAVRQHLERIARDDSHVWIRRAAVKALGKLGDRKARAVLSQIAATDLESRVRRQARKSLWLLR